MDRNQKFLKRLSKQEFIAIEKVLKKIKSGDIRSLDVKKLSGYQDIYRVRIKNIRIIFLTNVDRTEILEISRRSEKTYKRF